MLEDIKARTGTLPGQLLAAFTAAGLTDLEWYRRGPTGDEAATERLYVLGRRT